MHLASSPLPLLLAALGLLGSACAGAQAASGAAPTAAPTADAAGPATLMLGQSDPSQPHCFLSPEGDRVCPTMGQALVYDEEAAAQLAVQMQEQAREMDVAEDDIDVGERRDASGEE